MKQGFSLMDWNNLARVADLAQGQHSTNRPFTMNDVRKRKDWCVIRGKVYDYTKYTPYHPGGSEELERGAGDDCTALFEEFHPWVNVDAMLRKCQVGILVDPSVTWTRSEIVHREKLGGHFYRVRMSIKHDENLVKELQDMREKHILFHVKVRTRMGNAKRFIERPYTPLIGMEFDDGNNDEVISLLVKRSLRTNRSCLTHAICADEDATAQSFDYELQLKPCLFFRDDWFHKSSSLGMVCAGSGITPALQVLSRETQNPDSQRRLYLVWCNRDEKHMSLQTELQELMLRMKGRLTLIHLFSRLKDGASPDFGFLERFESYEVGRFDEGFLSKRPDALPGPSKSDNVFDSSILICGPWDFEKSVRATMFMAGFSTDALIRVPG